MVTYHHVDILMFRHMDIVTYSDIVTFYVTIAIKVNLV